MQVVKTPLKTIRFATDPHYRVVLIYNKWKRDVEVAQKIKIGVPVVSDEHAIKCVNIARNDGSALILTAPLHDAEIYHDNLEKTGLKVILDEL